MSPLRWGDQREDFSRHGVSPRDRSNFGLPDMLVEQATHQAEDGNR